MSPMALAGTIPLACRTSAAVLAEKGTFWANMGKSQPSAPPARRVREKTKSSAVEKQDTKKDKKKEHRSSKAVIQKGKTVKVKQPEKHTRKESKNANTKTGASKKDSKSKKEEKKIAKKVEKPSAKSQVVAKPKKENKDKTEDKPKRPSALRNAPTTPVANNRDVARGTSASLDGGSIASSGGVKFDELSELENAEKQAAALGVSLSEYLTDHSEKALEEHMKLVMSENQAEASKAENEEGSEEEGSDEDHGPASESSEEEDQEEDEEKSQPPSPLRLEDTKEAEPGEKSESESAESDSSSSSSEEEELGPSGEMEAPTSKVTEVVGVANSVDASAKKALENSILKFLEQHLPFLFFPQETWRDSGI